MVKLGSKWEERETEADRGPVLKWEGWAWGLVMTESGWSKGESAGSSVPQSCYQSEGPQSVGSTQTLEESLLLSRAVWPLALGSTAQPSVSSVWCLLPLDCKTVWTGTEFVLHLGGSGAKFCTTSDPQAFISVLEWVWMLNDETGNTNYGLGHKMPVIVFQFWCHMQDFQLVLHRVTISMKIAPNRPFYFYKSCLF